jgi:phage gpG-like protein
MDNLVNKAVELIRKRTRLGYSVEKNGGTKKKLKALSSEYVEFRKKNKKLSGKTRSKKSNLTFTGDMLDDLEIVNTSNGHCEIGFKSSESQEKAKWVSKNRPFLHLSKSEIKQLIQDLNARIKALLKE